MYMYICIYIYVIHFSYSATSAKVRTHDNDELVDFPSTLRASICRDCGVICQLDSFKCNHTEAAKERDIYRLQTHVIIWPCLSEWVMVHISITLSYETRDHSTVHSTAGVCVVFVTLRLCVCLTKDSSITASNYGTQENRMQVVRQNKQM